MTTGSEVWLDGVWTPRDKARVSVFDRGYMFGDGVYEVVAAYDGRPFLAEQHARRLAGCLTAIGIPDPHGEPGWISLIGQIARRQNFADQKIYIQVTRGPAPRAHRFPARTKPTVLLFSDPLVLPAQGEPPLCCTALTHPDFRWQRGGIKSTSLLAAVLMSEHAAATGADETILIRDGTLTEGASSNVLVCSADTLAAPTADELVLRGVTLDHVAEISAQDGWPIERRDIGENELRAADEIMICSTTREVAAVTMLDGKPVGNGQAQTQARRLANLYRASARRQES